MKISKKQLILSIVSIFIVLASLAVMICDYLIPLDFYTHPILTFVFCLSVGFGVLSFVTGIINKSVWLLFVSAFPFAFMIMYPFAHYDFWWIGLVVVFVVLTLIGIFCYILMGNRTEAIALNASPEYKNYEQRKAEKQKLEEEKAPEELPEIKSFK